MADDIVTRLRQIAKANGCEAGRGCSEAADEIQRLRAERDTERALADQLADALRWQADPYQKGTLMMSHRALDAYEKIRRG